MLPAVRSVPPGGAGEWEEGETAWTGEKRRKTTRSSPPGDDADMMDIQLQLQEGQDGKGGGERHPPEDESGIPVFSVNDEISAEELHLCLRKIKSRKPTIFVRFASRISSEKEQDELYERFCQLRSKPYAKMIKPDGTNAPTGSNCAHDQFDWNHSCGPDRIYDWTIDSEYFDLAELSDYERIIPTREDIYEYRDWEEYRLTFSDYETDEDYVKYCDELSKKIKWIEEYQHLDDIEFSKLKRRGYKQAMKIAAEFSYLPASLAARGYEEHVYYIERNKGWKDLDKLHFETWKRVTKQKMSFRQALEEILVTNMFPSRGPLIESEIQGVTRFLYIQFKICMEHIPENAEVNDELLEQFTYMIFKGLKPKTYACYVRKKLEIGRRLQLTPSRIT